MIGHDDLTAATENLIHKFIPFVSTLLFISGDGSSASQVTNNGTVSFVDTGTKRLVVTCAHIIERFKQRKKHDPKLWMALGLPRSARGPTVQLRRELMIECGKENTIDLATFSLQEPDVIVEFGKQYFRCSDWPPAKPKVDEIIAIVGFPGDHRKVTSGGAGLQTTANGLSISIDAVSDRYIKSVDVDQTRLVVKLDAALGDLGSLAGMSGSAVYQISQDGTPRLVGFFCEAGEHGGKHVPILATHAHFFKADGHLDWSRVTW